MGSQVCGDNVNTEMLQKLRTQSRQSQPLAPTWPLHTTGSNASDRKDTRDLGWDDDTQSHSDRGSWSSESLLTWNWLAGFTEDLK